MRLRVGPLDLAAVVIVLVVLLLPPRAMEVESAFAEVDPAQVDALTGRVAAAQAALARDPGDGVAAQELAEIWSAKPVAQHDQARRVAGEAASHADSPTRWRALLALSWTHAEQIDIPAAFAVAEQARAACLATPATCPAHERSRIDVYRDELAAGVEAIARGADPRHDPAGFRRELAKTHPTTTFRPVRSR